MKDKIMIVVASFVMSEPDLDMCVSVIVCVRGHTTLPPTTMVRQDIDPGKFLCYTLLFSARI
jgi:hypothetical protein